jgi:sigma-E factor negative regulatory protein RseB
MLLLPVQAVASKCPDADSVALKWLDKMSRSSYEVSYNGVVTFQRGDDLQVMQVAHTAANGTASESLTQLTGQGAQVVRVDHPLQCIHPGHRLLRLGADMESGDCGISNHYRFSVGEGLLKTQTQGPDRKTLERFQFANLSYTGEAPGAGSAELVHHAHHPVPPTGPTDSLSSGRWKVRWVPEGFTVTDVTEGDSTRKTYTDGLAVFSVFLEQLSRQIKPGEGVVRRGGTTSYTRGMNLSGEYILVTVIGEVPLNTARMVADSINWAD